MKILRRRKSLKMRRILSVRRKPPALGSQFWRDSGGEGRGDGGRSGGGWVGEGGGKEEKNLGERNWREGEGKQEGRGWVGG